MDLQKMGLFMIIIGLVFFFGHKIGFLGHLPGDFYYQGDKLRVAFPLMTCILLSILLSLLFRSGCK